jgi:hypothetical protein
VNCGEQTRERVKARREERPETGDGIQPWHDAKVSTETTRRASPGNGQHRVRSLRCHVPARRWPWCRPPHCWPGALTRRWVTGFDAPVAMRGLADLNVSAGANLEILRRPIGTE